MCRVLDDILPVAGAIVGSFIPGLGTALGAGIGGAIGGGISGYAQNHNLMGTFTGAASGGIGGYFGGGALANVLANAGESAAEAGLTTGFDTGLAANVAPSTLGGLESATGGSALFGPMSGTGMALGSEAGALGGNSLGLAGSDALSGLSSGGSQYLGGLGGGYSGMGGLNPSEYSTVENNLFHDLTGSASSPYSPTNMGMAGQSPGSLGATAGEAPSPIASSGVGNLGGIGTTGPTQPIGGVNLGEGTQVPTTGSGAPVAFDQSTSGAGAEGMQAAQTTGGQQGALAAMYGPNSTAAGSTMGQGITGTNVEVPGANNVQYGALGEGTRAAPGMAGATTGAAKVGEEGTGLQDLYNQVSPWMKLGQVGQNMFQQISQQGKYNDYVNQINQMYSPNSPYAQQMAQTLARQDARYGRNSQYGSRAVQLAAALTDAHTRALTSAPYSQASFANPMANALNGLFAFNSPQGVQALQGLYNAGSSGLNSLANLFGG